MNWDKAITLVAILGVIALAGAALAVYGTDGKDITQNAISGLLGFAGGAGAGVAVGYAIKSSKQEGE